MLVTRHDNLAPENNFVIRTVRRIYPVTNQLHGSHFFVRIDGVRTATTTAIVHEVLKDIAEIDPRLEQTIACRYFAGLSINDTAEALGMAVRTVERDWQRAKDYLLQAVDTGGAAWPNADPRRACNWRTL